MAVAIGLVGSGRWASEVHAPSLKLSPSIQFAGVWARSPDAARKLAERNGVPAYGRYDELLDQCDAVAFAVPPAVQAELAATAALRGKAVLLEKPIAGDLAGAEVLAEAVAKGGVVSQIALTWRYSAGVRRFLREEVPRTWPQGGTGRLISGVLAQQAANPWRTERGTLLDQGPHLIDLLDASLGRIVDVRAHGQPLGWIGLLLEHEGGRFSEASLSATTGLAEPYRATVEIFGSGGAAAVDCAASVGPDTFETMFREFGEAVERGTPHELDVRRGLHLQRVLEAADTDLLRGA